jgi:hypothetical protein
MFQLAAQQIQQIQGSCSLTVVAIRSARFNHYGAIHRVSSEGTAPQSPMFQALHCGGLQIEAKAHAYNFSFLWHKGPLHRPHSKLMHRLWSTAFDRTIDHDRPRSSANRLRSSTNRPRSTAVSDDRIDRGRPRSTDERVPIDRQSTAVDRGLASFCYQKQYCSLCCNALY